MPREPVLVDDGGSIRIKNFNGNGKIDGLLDVGPLPNGTIGSKGTIDGDFTEFMIVRHKKSGDLNKRRKQKFNTILIECQLNQYVLAEQHSHKLRITVYGKGIEPMVELRQSANNCSYFVLNFGPIKTITANKQMQGNLGRDDKKPSSITIDSSVYMTGVLIT
jgi:hypothetical protein